MVRRFVFAVPSPGVENRTKTVSRLSGSVGLIPGALFPAVMREEAFGACHSRPVGRVRILNCRPEPLDQVTEAEVRREGFPDLTPSAFVDLFRAINGGERGQRVTRVEFEWVAEC